MRLHPTAPLARHDQMGLLWALRGQTVTDLGAKAARLSGGLSLRRRYHDGPQRCDLDEPNGIRPLDIPREPRTAAIADVAVIQAA